MARAKQTGPRYGSRCRFALRVIAHAGAMTQADWRLMSDFPASHVAFDRDVIRPLLDWKLVDRADSGFIINDAGRRFMGLLPDAVATPAREPYRMRPLSAQHRPLRHVSRPGALDYRDIPSRLGDQLIPHGEKAAA